MARLVNVTAADVREAAYGLAIPDGQQVDTAIDAVIQKATARVYSAFPSIDSRITAGTLDDELVAGVVEDMVIRVLRNPNAYRQVTIDDYTRMIDTALSTGSLYLSTEERELLAPRARSKRVRSMRVAAPNWRLP